VGEDRTGPGRRGVDRLSIQDAARRLNISEGAVRKRVARGTLRYEKAPDGRVYVYLDSGVDSGQDAGVDANSSALISQLRGEVDYLRDESRRKDEIIMLQAMSMKALTAPQERESGDSAAAQRTEVSEGSETASPPSITPSFLPSLKDELPLRDYLLAVGVPLAWIAFSEAVVTVVLDADFLVQPIDFLLNLVPLSIILLFSGFWLGVRRRGGLSLPSLGLVGLFVTVGSPVAGWMLWNWPLEIPLNVLLLEGISDGLLIVAGALLGNAVQRRGLKTGIYGDDPAANAPNLQSNRAISNLVIGSGAATIIAALINAIATVLAR